VEDRRIFEALRLDSRGESAVELVPLLYRELKRLAHTMRAARPHGVTLQTTDIVHEAYLKLVDNRDPGWNGRAHFFGAAARAMREILVDRARRNGRIKHGGGSRRVEVDDFVLAAEVPGDDIIALHEALEELEEEDPRKGEIVNLRFFAGMTTQETANLLGMSVRTVEREWRYVRSWLYERLSS